MPIFTGLMQIQKDGGDNEDEGQTQNSKFYGFNPYTTLKMLKNLKMKQVYKEHADRVQ